MTFEPCVCLNNTMLQSLVVLSDLAFYLVECMCDRIILCSRPLMTCVVGCQFVVVSVWCDVEHLGWFPAVRQILGSLQMWCLLTGSQTTVEANVEVTVMLLGMRGGQWGKRLSASLNGLYATPGAVLTWRPRHCSWALLWPPHLLSAHECGGWSAFCEGQTWTWTHSVTYRGPWKEDAQLRLCRGAALVISDLHVLATSPSLQQAQCLKRKK